MQQPAWQTETALTKLREARSQSVASAEQLALSTYRLLAAQEDARVIVHFISDVVWVQHRPRREVNDVGQASTVTA